MGSQPYRRVFAERLELGEESGALVITVSAGREKAYDLTITHLMPSGDEEYAHEQLQVTLPEGQGHLLEAIETMVLAAKVMKEEA